MAKKIKAILKLQIAAGKANPAPPVGPALGQHGVNIMAFCKEYNDRTNSQAGSIIPVEITIFEDNSFTFVTKTPPTTDLLKRALGVEKGSESARWRASLQDPHSGARVGFANLEDLFSFLRRETAGEADGSRPEEKGGER